MTVFFTSDLHIGHKNVLMFDVQRGARFSCIEEHDEYIIDTWNSQITKRDSIWVLGDVVFGVDNFELLGRLRGTKKLVLGNHDQYDVRRYLKYFTKVFGVKRHKDCILSHVPVHPNQLEFRFKLNIHGHNHAGFMTRQAAYFFQEPDTRYFNVATHLNDFKPVPWELIEEVLR